MFDLGANIECDENNLIEFSEMGAALHKALFPEEKQGSFVKCWFRRTKDRNNKKAYTKLKEFNNNEDFIFTGYIEGNKIIDGDSNVIITDGFTGNIALKTAEGTAKFITDNLKLSLKENFYQSSLNFHILVLKNLKKD